MSDIVQRQSSVIAPVIAFDTEIEIVASEGSYVVSRDGSRYLDFTCGIAVSNLGHQHPAVKAAMLNQLDQVWHAGGVFRYDTFVTAAERLRQVTPDGIDKFFFMNSGAEAVEGSMKLARKTSGRQGIIVFRGGFHGRTMGSVTYTTSKAKYRQGYHPLVGSVFVTPFPRPFRWGMSEEAATDRALEDLGFMFKHEITPGEVAAFLVEPLQGEGGYYPAGKRFLHELRRMADEHGILLVIDEVQTGFGRTGDWFTSQVYDVRPDILVMGKAIANGMPLSAVGAPASLMDAWPPGSHGTTFGGNPVSCAAAIGTIQGLMDVVPQVPKLSEHAFSRFNELKEVHPTIGDVRGLGLMIGVELVAEDGHTPSQPAIDAVRKHCQQHHMLVLPCGPDENVIRFIPPLNVTLEDLDKGIDVIDGALSAWEA
ncbi:MAG TPA: aminotransferase class III-fold pyridoxal phosphate-dependent enzyme [Acidimicrobiia bacterium]|jgi:4-aminobutyrate aminotransferase|nr:aminotransferase class III-fold pyridoxal phosphate-dependent enzyme [Acidimicrobiia bacterium]